MDDSVKTPVRDLVRSRRTAALATLHQGAPFVSMVPFAFDCDESAFLIHVSRLATHTSDMLAEPRVSLLITAPEETESSTLALPRLTVGGVARAISKEDLFQERAKELYVKKFPDALPIFDFADFWLFAIAPTSVRWVGGFGKAYTITPEEFARLMRA
ncbi:MAG: pyridoxamine 5'-phosphate oxidase family protein [Nibricoccus sp.]